MDPEAEMASGRAVEQCTLTFVISLQYGPVGLAGLDLRLTLGNLGKPSLEARSLPMKDFLRRAQSVGIQQFLQCIRSCPSRGTHARASAWLLAGSFWKSPRCHGTGPACALSQTGHNFAALLGLQRFKLSAASKTFVINCLEISRNIDTAARQKSES
jgi:hypothetical protein